MQMDAECECFTAAVIQARRKHFGSGAAIGTKKTAGGLGGTVSPQRVQGRALVGAQGAKPPEAP